MNDREFVLRMRIAGGARYFRFTGDEALELHRMRTSGLLERPGGTRRLTEMTRGREPDSVLTGNPTNLRDADFDMVSDGDLRMLLSHRLLERRGAREGDGGPLE